MEKIEFSKVPKNSAIVITEDAPAIVLRASSPSDRRIKLRSDFTILDSEGEISLDGRLCNGTASYTVKNGQLVIESDLPDLEYALMEKEGIGTASIISGKRTRIKSAVKQERLQL